MEWSKIGIIIVLLIIIVYFSIRYYYTAGKIKVYEKGPINLSKQTTIIGSDDAKALMQSTNGCTISMYIKLNGHDKTGYYKGVDIPIVEQPGCWAFQYVPISKDSAIPTYQFSVNTIDSKGVEKIEIIPLSSFPEQKWTYLTILKEGRRFDIMYNNKIIGSTYLVNYPKIQTQAIRIGDTRLNGDVAYINGASRRYTVDEIANEWGARADTRGKPYLSDSFSLPTFGCPNGLFCFTAPSGPTSMKKYWSSPYA
jgi:hypothetical protein